MQEAKKRREKKKRDKNYTGASRGAGSGGASVQQEPTKSASSSAVPQTSLIKDILDERTNYRGGTTEEAVVSKHPNAPQ